MSIVGRCRDLVGLTLVCQYIVVVAVAVVDIHLLGMKMPKQTSTGNIAMMMPGGGTMPQGMFVCQQVVVVAQQQEYWSSSLLSLCQSQTKQIDMVQFRP